MLTKNEKIELLDGLDVWRLKHFNKLKKLMMADGPHGLRKQSVLGDNLGISGSEVSIAYPTASNLACSFDKKLIKEMANTLAKDALSQEIGIILGPGINIKRNPLCGRNFEYFSEDPHLTGELAKSYITGIEEMGVGTSVKHFFANNQERYRFTIDSIIDERTLYDIYLKPFKKAVEAKPATVMASYNKINGIHGTNHPIINNVLRDKWGYEGVLVSDWGAVTNRVEELKNGLDLQMPSSHGFHSNLMLEELNKNNNFSKYINTSSDRILNLIDKYGELKKTNVNLEDHHKKAIKFAEAGMVLLKNQNILPIDKNENILFVGGFTEEIRFQGGGSSYINPYKVLSIKDINKDIFSNSKVLKGYHLNDFEVDEKLTKEVIESSKSSNKIVYFMGLPERLETEGIDRKNLNLPKNQLILLDEILKVNKEVIVVLLTGSVVNINFKDKVKGILLSYLGGEGTSEALLNLLSGKVSPSGRLSETWIKSLDNLPFKLKNNNNAIYYDETIFVGYRYYNTFNIPVNYPFGYGLSYANFKYSNYSIEKSDKEITVKFALKNESNIKASEVVQIYLERDKSHTYHAKRELVAFDKFHFNELEEKEVSIKIKIEDLKYYDTKHSNYILEQANYIFHISNNVNDSFKQLSINLEGIKFDNQIKDYHLLYNDHTFYNIYEKILPNENIKYKKPLNINMPLEAFNKTLVGKLIVKFILSEAIKELKGADSWVSDNIKESLIETPLRCIASFAGDAMNYEMAECLVLLANNKILKGYKKYKKGVKLLDEQSR